MGFAALTLSFLVAVDRYSFSSAGFLTIATGIVALNNWHERILRACPSTTGFSWYRLVSGVTPQAFMIFAVVVGQRDLSSLLATFLFGLIVGHVGGLKMASPEVNYVRLRLNSEEGFRPPRYRRRNVAQDIAVTFSGLGQTFFPRVDLVYLSATADRSTVGAYSMAASAILLSSVLPFIAGVDQFRSSTRPSSRSQELRRSVLLLAAQAALGATLSVLILVPLAGSQFAAARVPSAILFLGTLPSGIANIYAERWRGMARNSWVVASQIIAVSVTLGGLFWFGSSDLNMVAFCSVAGSSVSALWVVIMLSKEGKANPTPVSSSPLS